jgi:hypothetical protein
MRDTLGALVRIEGLIPAVLGSYATRRTDAITPPRYPATAKTGDCAP